MCFMTQMFTAEELAALDEKEAEILRQAILEQIQTSPEINGLLRKMLNKEPGSQTPAQS